jgi:hypothetical protein
MANNSEREASTIKAGGYHCALYCPLGQLLPNTRHGAAQFFVSRVVAFPDGDFATAVDKIKQSGVELIVGSEAKEPLGKMEQVKGVLPRTDNIEEIWEVENWGEDEWTEQVLAEFAFCKAMNVQFFPDSDNRRGADYRMRRAPSGLVLVPSDNDEDIFVAVKVEKAKGFACVEGWLRRSEGKLSKFYQKNCWVIPLEALHDMEELPGKEGLRAMAPFQELSP